MNAPPLDDAAMVRLARARPLLVLFDIDGTLAPIAPRPQDAVVPPAVREGLASLAARPEVHVGLVTGRAAADGARMVGLPGLWVIGNHGVETWDPEGTCYLAPGTDAFVERLARAFDALRGPAAHVPGALLEDKRWSLSLHYRLASPDLVPSLREAAERVARDEGLRFSEGKRIFELHMPIDVHKGTAIVALADRLGVLDQGAVLFIGDDRTDEDAFEALARRGGETCTIRVGPPDTPTSAAWRVDDPAGVHRMIERLDALLGATATA